MILPTLHQLRIIRSRVDDPEGTARLVSDASRADGARVIKSGPRHSVLGIVIDGQDLIIRTTRLERLKDHPARWSGRTHAMRHWHGATLLEGAALPSAPLHVLFRALDAEGVIVETLVAERVEGESLLHCTSPSLDLCRAVGRHVARLLDAGLFHRDHKASNLVVRAGASGPVLVIVDADGVRRSSRRDACERMLMSTLIEFVGVGETPRRGACAAVLRACLQARGQGAEWKETWRRVERMVAAHGDPTPKDDPRRYEERLRSG